MKNLLPKDGTLLYYSDFISEKKADDYINLLNNEIHFEPDIIRLFGKQIVTKRLVAWHGDFGVSYKYSGVLKEARPWTKTLLKLKEEVEEKSNQEFNSCLLNYYENGEIGMAYHSDDEPELKANGCIASVSLGATRKMLFRHKESHQKVDVWLDSGSLLLMEDEIQHYWKHAIPKTKRSPDQRINLTFRQIVDPKTNRTTPSLSSDLLGHKQ